MSARRLALLVALLGLALGGAWLVGRGSEAIVQAGPEAVPPTHGRPLADAELVAPEPPAVPQEGAAAAEQELGEPRRAAVPADAAPPAAAALALELVDDRGAPLSEARLELERSTDAGVQEHRTIDGRGPGGRYAVEGLRPGRWRVVPIVPGYLPAEGAGAVPRAVDLPRDGPPLRFVLRRPGSVAGRVVDAFGAPAQRASVRVHPHGMPPPYTADLSRITDEEGAFRFEGVPSLPATVRATRDDLETELDVEVAPGSELGGLLLTLPQGGTVHLTLLDGAGRPAGDRVAVLLAGTGEVDEERTDGDGVARFGPIPQGTYTVAALLVHEDQVNEGELFEHMLTAPADVVEGREARVVLRPSGRSPIEVTGRVTQDGQPVDGQDFLVFREGGSLIETVRFFETDDDGRFAFRLDGPGGVVFSVLRSRGPKPVRRVEVPDVASFRVELELPAGRVVGTVQAPPGQPRNAQLWLEREDGYLALRFPDDDFRERAGGDGAFAIERVEAGTYTLRGATEQALLEPVVDLVVGEGQTVRVDPVLAPGPRVRVRVRDAADRPRAAGVTLCDSSGLPLVPIPVTAEGGEKLFPAVPPGEWWASARALDGGAEGAAWASAPVRVPDGGPGEEVLVALRLEAGATLTARAVDGRGTPVTAALRAWDATGREVSEWHEPGLVGDVFTRPFRSSERTFGPLVPGEYRVEASTPDGRRATRRVTLVAGSPQSVDLRL